MNNMIMIDIDDEHDVVKGRDGQKEQAACKKHFLLRG